MNIDTIKLKGCTSEMITSINRNHPLYELDQGRVRNLSSGEKELIPGKDSIICGNLYGITGIQVGKDEFTMELSSKILEKYYPKHINENTIEQVIDTVNKKQSAIQINTSKIGLFSVLKADVINDIKVENYEFMRKVFRMIRVGIKGNYSIDEYSETSVAFKKLTQHNKCRQKFYDKQADIQRSKIDMLKLPFEDFVNVMRVEIQLRSFDNMKSYAGINGAGNIHLMELLQKRSAHPNYKFLKEHQTTAKELKCKEYMRNLEEAVKKADKWQEVREQAGDRYILEGCNWDENILKQHLKKFYKHSSGVRRMLLEYSQQIMLHNIEEQNKNKYDLDVMTWLLKELSREGNDMLGYLTTSDLATATGKSERTMERECKKRGYTPVLVGHGVKEYRIPKEDKSSFKIQGEVLL